MGISAQGQRRGILERVGFRPNRSIGKRRRLRTARRVLAFHLRSDLPLSFHPARTSALWVDTPVGAGGATGIRAQLSDGAARV